MVVKRRLRGGILATIGFILSPLSWWNDIFINLPIAYAFGFMFGLISKELFTPFLIIGYWLSNILGMILLHYGFVSAVSKKDNRYTKNKLGQDLFISLAYTLFIVLLIYFGILKFPTEYFS
jgi:hypothetical protein